MQPTQTVRGVHAMFDGIRPSWLLDPGAFDLVETGMMALDLYVAGIAARRRM